MNDIISYQTYKNYTDYQYANTSYSFTNYQHNENYYNNQSQILYGKSFIIYLIAIYVPVALTMIFMDYLYYNLGNLRNKNKRKPLHNV